MGSGKVDCGQFSRRRVMVQPLHFQISPLLCQRRPTAPWPVWNQRAGPYRPRLIVQNHEFYRHPFKILHKLLNPLERLR